jgi:acetyltransferase-like isoleucine patch superfamily enzyme
MAKSLIKKVTSIVFGRPTQVWAYLRQTILFYQTYFLRMIFLNGKAQYRLGKNVRIQALKTLTAEPTAILMINDHSIVYEHARIEALGSGSVVIGENSIIGDARISSRKSIKVGKNFLTSWNVFIQDFDAHPISAALRSKQIESMTANFYPSFEVKPDHMQFEFDFPSDEIVIGDNVWVGANASILKGANIGDNCIIATGAIVLRGTYEANSILAGNPAKIVKKIV